MCPPSTSTEYPNASSEEISSGKIGLTKFGTVMYLLLSHSGVGETDGLVDDVGEVVGALVGDFEGVPGGTVGSAVGLLVGLKVGAFEGCFVGGFVGIGEGFPVG